MHNFNLPWSRGWYFFRPPKFANKHTCSSPLGIGEKHPYEPVFIHTKLRSTNHRSLPLTWSKVKRLDWVRLFKVLHCCSQAEFISIHIFSILTQTINIGNRRRFNSCIEFEELSNELYFPKIAIRTIASKSRVPKFCAWRCIAQRNACFPILSMQRYKTDNICGHHNIKLLHPFGPEQYWEAPRRQAKQPAISTNK